MELCPSPDHPTVVPDEKGQKLRKMLHLLYYGQMGVCFVRFILFGGLAGFFQLIHLWIIYTAYATLNFCTCLMYFMLCLLELMFILVDWRRVTQTSQDRYNYNTGNNNNPTNPSYPNQQEPGSYQTPSTPSQTPQVNPFLYLLFGYIFIYNLLAVFYSYRSFSHFKILFT
jgi:hypothetical protein